MAVARRSFVVAPARRAKVRLVLSSFSRLPSPCPSHPKNSPDFEGLKESNPLKVPARPCSDKGFRSVRLIQHAVRLIQVLVGATPWRFESSRAHCLFNHPEAGRLRDFLSAAAGFPHVSGAVGSVSPRAIRLRRKYRPSHGSCHRPRPVSSRNQCGKSR